MKKTKSIVDKPVYNLYVHVNGREYKSTGETISDAFTALGLTFQDVKTKGEIIVTYGEREASRILRLPELRRLLISKMLLTGFIRNLERLLV